MLSCSSSVCSAPLIIPYHGLSLDMAAYILNLNIDMGKKERVMDILLREGGVEREGVEGGGREERREGGGRGKREGEILIMFCRKCLFNDTKANVKTTLDG